MISLRWNFVWLWFVPCLLKVSYRSGESIQVEPHAKMGKTTEQFMWLLDMTSDSVTTGRMRSGSLVQARAQRLIREKRLSICGVSTMDAKKSSTSEMITTKIDFSHRRIAKLADVGELAEMFFPGNRNQQYAFLVIWVRLKWRTEGIVPNLGQFVTAQGVSRRTLERVRAKMRRMGLLEHVSRFDPRFGNREGWTLSDNFERGLQAMAEKVKRFKDIDVGSQEEDERILAMARARRDTLQESESEDEDRL